jgi:hypothetical protein
MATIQRQSSVKSSGNKAVSKDAKPATAHANAGPVRVTATGPLKPVTKPSQIYANIKPKVDTRRNSMSKVRLPDLFLRSTASLL